jgi:8-oxo-dGTP pyrophosphatase MutT (NUDIX family)
LKTQVQQQILQNPKKLVQLIRHRLNGNGLSDNWGVQTNHGRVKGSAVLLLLTPYRGDADESYEPCLILNKRSRKVLQPGDLCCPGGGVEGLDKLLSLSLRWPRSPLRKWPSWNKWKSMDRKKAQGLSLLLAAALREGWEEMRLNPLQVSFMGPLPVQKLMMFDRKIYPLVGWVPAHQDLIPNWEVDRIVYIPLYRLFDTQNYGRYRLTFEARDGKKQREEDFPCFVHKEKNGDEILWGATFRIIMDFLKMVFGFELPDLSTSKVIPKRLGKTYYKGYNGNPSKGYSNR